MLNQSNPVEAYGGPSNFAFADDKPLVPVRVPQLPVIEYKLKGFGDGEVDRIIVCQIAYDVQRYRGESGEWQYEFNDDPVVTSISEVKEWLCGVEQDPPPITQKMINGANQWLNRVDAEVRDAILQHIRG